MSRDTVLRVFPEALPADVCALITNQAMTREFEPARLYVSHDKHVTDASIRRSQLVMWDAHHWTSGLLFHYAHVANADVWRFALSVSQGTQFAAYGPGDKFEWHKDEFPESLPPSSGPAWAGLNRKLTVVANLSNPDEHEGGDLVFKDTYGRDYVDNTQVPLMRLRGSVAVYPSYVLHAVTEVLRGRRCSLSSWVVGPPFR